MTRKMIIFLRMPIFADVVPGQHVGNIPIYLTHQRVWIHTGQKVAVGQALELCIPDDEQQDKRELRQPRTMSDHCRKRLQTSWRSPTALRCQSVCTDKTAKALQTRPPHRDKTTNDISSSRSRTSMAAKRLAFTPGEVAQEPWLQPTQIYCGAPPPFKACCDYPPYYWFPEQSYILWQQVLWSCGRRGRPPNCAATCIS